MSRKLLRRYLPNPAQVRRKSALRPLRIFLNRPEIWHLNRRSISGAVFIGLFCAFLPLPFQMLLAGALAVASRRNLPVSVALVWISNPLTFAPMFYFAYRLGAWLLDMRLEAVSIEPSLDWWLRNLDDIAIPLLWGSLMCGWVAGLTGFVAVRALWRLDIRRRWNDRRARRRVSPNAALPPGFGGLRDGRESRRPAGKAARKGRR